MENPPSTGTLTPVTNVLAALARNTATPPNSPGSPHLPAGVLVSTFFCNAGKRLRELAVISVLNQPGKMTLTYMNDE